MNFTFIQLDFAGGKKKRSECIGRLFQISCFKERNVTPTLPIGKLSGERQIFGTLSLWRPIFSSKAL